MQGYGSGSRTEGLGFVFAGLRVRALSVAASPDVRFPIQSSRTNSPTWELEYARESSLPCSNLEMLHVRNLPNPDQLTPNPRSQTLNPVQHWSPVFC